MVGGGGAGCEGEEDGLFKGVALAGGETRSVGVEEGVAFGAVAWGGGRCGEGCGGLGFARIGFGHGCWCGRRGRRVGLERESVVDMGCGRDASGRAGGRVTEIADLRYHGGIR